MRKKLHDFLWGFGVAESVYGIAVIIATSIVAGLGISIFPTIVLITFIVVVLGFLVGIINMLDGADSKEAKNRCVSNRPLARDYSS